MKAATLANLLRDEAGHLRFASTVDKNNDVAYAFERLADELDLVMDGENEG